MERFINYYAVLGIPSDASEEEIRKAFRVLAKTYHPDINPDPEARRRFILVEQAYEILIDTQKRAVFDASLTSQPHQSTGVSSPTPPGKQAGAGDKTSSEAPAAFFFPNFRQGFPAHFVLQGVPYSLTSEEVETLERDGQLRGGTGHQGEYLLMYCVRCHALFGTRRVRDRSGILYHPYEVYPVCPSCRAVEWCPADEEREKHERQAGTAREQEVKAGPGERAKQQAAAPPVYRSAGVSRSRLLSKRTVISALVALVLLGGSLGLVLVHTNQVATQNAQATSTAFTQQSLASTSSAGTATARVALATAQVVGATAQAQTQATAQAQATATATTLAALNPDPSFHTLALSDPLASNGNGWDENGITGSGCMFEADGYHVTSSVSGFLTFCLLRNHSFDKFVYLAQMKILKGDCGGLIFRSTESDSPSAYYVSVCQNGYYALVRQSGGPGTILLSQFSDSIKRGLNKTNAVAVVAKGSDIDLYINKTHVMHFTDSTFKSGDVGVLANQDLGSVGGQNIVADTVYSNVYIWTA